MLDYINEHKYIISASKDITNILFFIFTGLLAFLSYLNARRTLFSPIKTEIFKMQVKEFELIIDRFRDADEAKIISQFDEEKILFMNFCKIMMKYSEFAFDQRIKFPAYDTSDICGRIISPELVEKCIVKIEVFSNDPEETQSDPNTQSWIDNKFGVLDITKKYIKNSNKIKKLAASPILPEIISRRLWEIPKDQDKNLKLMIDVLEEFRIEPPSICPRFEDMAKINHSGIFNKYNERRKEIMPSIDCINSDIKNHLKIEKIIN